MSDEEDFDDTPPEACFFTKRATFIPKVSAEEFLSVAKLLTETGEGKLNFTNKKIKFQDRVKPGRKGQTGKSSALKKIVPPVSNVVDDGDDKKDFIPLVVSPSHAVLSAAAKRRLKRQQDERADELKLIEAANQEILSAVDSTSFHEVEEVDLEDSFDSFSKVILTVSYMAEVSRLRCDENEKFSSIFPKVADLFCLKATEILLCLRDQNIKVDDTPKSLKITLDDVLECIPYKPTEDDIDDALDKFKLFFQSENTKEKVELLVHKLEKMQDIMQRYANHLKTQLEHLNFEFDGDKIKGTETPEDLDMDAGSCIDVKFLVSPPISIKRKVEETQVSIPRGQRGRGRGQRGRGRGQRGRGKGHRTNWSTRKGKKQQNAASVITLDDSSTSRDSSIVPLVTSVDDSNTSRDSDIMLCD